MMTKLSRFSVIRAAVLGLLLPAAPAWANADVRMPHILGNNMVLQREMPLPIWGAAEPNQQITVQLGEHKAETKANAQGIWNVTLPAMPAGGPYSMTILGKNKLELTNILVGEVWLCSGQSNMQWGIKSAKDPEKEIATANYPKLRLFTVKLKTASEPLNDVEGQWTECNPETIVTNGSYEAGFSAIAYFFGREIHKELNVPVGLINTAWGGTKIEPWTPKEGFAAVPSLQEFVKQIEDAGPAYRELQKKTLVEYEAWIAKARKAQEEQKDIPTPPAWPPKHPLDHNAMPTGIYNAMIHPLIPYAIRGAIWYQGESNNPDGMIYCDKMKAMVGGWRGLWKQGDFPFYYVQIAPLDQVYEGDRLPKLWEAQTAALAIPHTGMVVTNDIGDLKDIHPKNKQEVGRRLALWALAKTYGQKDRVCSGPIYKSMSKDGNKIRIAFEGADNGLASRDGKPLNWFTIAGEDKQFVEAVARIDGNTVIVSSEKVAAPVAVRFGWNRAAEPNLMNKDGLPASAFRTDSW